MTHIARHEPALLTSADRPPPRRVQSAHLLALFGAVTLLAYLLPPSGARSVVISALLILAPLTCFAACFTAARATGTPASGPWILFAIAATLAAVGQTHWHTLGEALEPWHALPAVAATALIAAGIGWLLHLRDRDRLIEIGLDTALILAAVTVVTLRWSPPGLVVLDSAPGWQTEERIGILGGPIAAGCAVIFGSVLLFVRGGSRAGAAAAAVALSTVGFAVAAFPLAKGGGPCCSAGHLAGLGSILGWLLLAYAGVRVRAEGALAFQPAGAEAGGMRLRMVVAPGVAVVMAAVAVDSFRSAPLANSTAFAVGVLGVLLAVRVNQLLRATRTLSAERAELAQSRAMIEVSQALARTTRLDETLDLITDHAVRLLGGRAAAIELLTPDGRFLEFRATHGLPPEALGVRSPVEGSFTGWVVAHGRARAASDLRLERYLAVPHLAQGGHGSFAAAPLRYRDATLGALSCVGTFPFSRSDLELLSALADQAAVAIENARLFQQVHQLSLTDPLTGLANRRQLQHDLAREFSAAQRGRRLVAIMFDLNEFKEYNDRHGHVAGDEALKLFASALASEMRIMNMAARYGGDEFIALLADADRYGAEVFIERVRLRFPGQKATPPATELSFSAGWAEFDDTMNAPEQLVAAADRALYAAKSLRPAEQ